MSALLGSAVTVCRSGKCGKIWDFKAIWSKFGTQMCTMGACFRVGNFVMISKGVGTGAPQIFKFVQICMVTYGYVSMYTDDSKIWHDRGSHGSTLACQI